MIHTNAVLTGKRCQWSACGEFFSTDSNFDRRRKGEKTVPTISAEDAE